MQARPGSTIERLSKMRRRRRGEYRLCKVTPEVLSGPCGLLRPSPSPPPAAARRWRKALACGARAPCDAKADRPLVRRCPQVSTLVLHYRDELWWARQRQLNGAAAAANTGVEAPRASASTSSDGVAVKSEPGMPKLNTVKREAGETGRAPDGKRRKLASAPQGEQEVVVLSD